MQAAHKPPTKKPFIMHKGKRYQMMNTNIHYGVSEHERTNTIASLVDRGSNGGLGGEDVRLLESTLRKADISGIDDFTIKDVPIGTVAGVSLAYMGNTQVYINLILHQYAYLGTGKTIHSSIQLEDHQIEVNDKSYKVKGGRQALTTPDGYIIPLQIRGGLAYLDMHPPTDQELDEYPHIVLTADIDWDPTVLDCEL